MIDGESVQITKIKNRGFSLIKESKPLPKIRNSIMVMIQAIKYTKANSELQHWRTLEIHVSSEVHCFRQSVNTVNIFLSLCI